MTEPSPVTIRRVETAEQLEEAFAIRRLVFVTEQQVDEAVEIDGLDAHANHLLAYGTPPARAEAQHPTATGENHAAPIGTLRTRLIEHRQVIKIERVAVLKEWRKNGVGRELMLEAISLGRTSGASRAKLHAQTHVAKFYESLGFESVGSVFEEDAIPHIAMYLSYDQP